MIWKSYSLVAAAMVGCAVMARPQTVETNTFAEINFMARLWESDPIQITSLANTQYPSFNGGTWQYLVPVTSLASDGDIHIDMAISSSGTGSTGNNAGESPIISEVINASSAQLSHLTAFNDGQGKPVGIFRFYHEHTGERHLEIHPVLQLYKWNVSSNAFVFDTDYHVNITNDPNGTTHSASTLMFSFNGSDRMLATVMPDNNHLIFTWQSPSVNYEQYDGVAMSGLTNDFVSQYFWFHPTNPVFTIIPPVLARCRIITNTVAATLAAGLVSNQTLTVNALTRTDLLVVSNTIALMTSGQSTNITRPVELITLGILNLGLLPPPVAAFAGSPTTGAAPLTVTFTDSSTGAITNRFWTFGDGGTSNTTATSLEYVYNAAGTNTVTLIVTGSGGANTNTRPNYIVALTAFQAWQIQYFGSVTNPAAAPNADPDGDGFTNMQEFQAGTDPTNNGSAFHILSVVADPSGDIVTWAAASNKVYQLQLNFDLVNGAWSNVAASVTDTVGQAALSQTNAISPAVVRRFYRVLLLP